MKKKNLVVTVGALVVVLGVVVTVCYFCLISPAVDLVPLRKGGQPLLRTVRAYERRSSGSPAAGEAVYLPGSIADVATVARPSLTPVAEVQPRKVVYNAAFALLVSAYFFLRGHNQPGGGFIAGLVTAIALLLQTVAAGPAALRPDLGPQGAYRRKLALLHTTLGASLLVACAAGLGSWLFAYPFLTSTFAHPVLPIVGELPLASAAVFDLGVYLAVVGATVLALTGVGRLARRKD